MTYYRVVTCGTITYMLSTRIYVKYLQTIIMFSLHAGNLDLIVMRDDATSAISFLGSAITHVANVARIPIRIVTLFVILVSR